MFRITSTARLCEPGGDDEFIPYKAAAGYLLRSGNAMMSLEFADIPIGLND